MVIQFVWKVAPTAVGLICITQKASGCQSFLNFAVPQLQTGKEDWIRWNVAFSSTPWDCYNVPSRMLWWDNRSENQKPGAQGRTKGMPMNSSCLDTSMECEQRTEHWNQMLWVCDHSLLSSLPGPLPCVIKMTTQFGSTLFPHHTTINYFITILPKLSFSFFSQRLAIWIGSTNLLYTVQLVIGIK